MPAELSNDELFKADQIWRSAMGPRSLAKALQAERIRVARECAGIAEKELLTAQCSPAGLDHNGKALGEEIVKTIRRAFPEALDEPKP